MGVRDAVFGICADYLRRRWTKNLSLGERGFLI
jgi:hypothetical protein